VDQGGPPARPVAVGVEFAVPAHATFGGQGLAGQVRCCRCHALSLPCRCHLVNCTPHARWPVVSSSTLPGLWPRPGSSRLLSCRSPASLPLPFALPQPSFRGRSPARGESWSLTVRAGSLRYLRGHLAGPSSLRCVVVPATDKATLPLPSCQHLSADVLGWR